MRNEGARCGGCRPTGLKSVFQILRETVTARKLSEWAKLADISETDMVELAREFTSHGKKAVADIHRGVSQHTSGFYNVLTYMTLNTLIGNHDWQGGLSKATTFNITGDKEGKPFDVTKQSGKIKPFGVSIIRHGVKYDKTTIFKGYPAKRPWYPFASDIYQEVIPSIGDAYPYPVKALMLYMGSPVYALPAGHKLIEILSDPKKLPLFFASDIVIGETTMFADYIFPDLTYLERWAGGGYVSAHGGQHRLRRQARRLRKGASGQRRGTANLRKGPAPPAAHHL
jgi:anaerobic selenocysteine-containing dehydrogenase